MASPSRTKTAAESRLDNDDMDTDPVAQYGAKRVS